MDGAPDKSRLDVGSGSRRMWELLFAKFESSLNLAAEAEIRKPKRSDP